MNSFQNVSYQRTHPQGFRNYSRLLLLLLMGCPQVNGLNVGVDKLLAMAKNTNGLYPITIGKMFFQLFNYSTNGLYPLL